jgi:thiol peroxidase
LPRRVGARPTPPPAVKTASDYKHHDFAAKSGLLIKELGVLARAVYVVDKTGVVKYADLVKEVTTEPNYDGAIAAVKAAN